MSTTVIIDGHSLEVDEIVILSDEDCLCARFNPSLNQFLTPEQVFHGMINLSGIDQVRECTLATVNTQVMPPTTKINDWLNKPRPYTSIRKQNNLYTVFRDDQACLTFEAIQISHAVHLSIDEKQCFCLDASTRTISISGPETLIEQLRNRKQVAA